MKKLTLLFLFAMGSTVGFTGCGSDEYDIPPIDKEESAKAEAEIAKKMEAEMMKRMGGRKKR